MDKSSSKPVVVEIDNVFILGVPRTDTESGAADSAGSSQRAVKAKRLKLLLDDLVRETADSAENTIVQTVRGDNSLASFIATVVENARLFLRNLHVRYEDHFTVPERPFALGVTLSQVAVQSTNSDFKPAWVRGILGKISHRTVEITALSVYWDHLAPEISFVRLPRTSMEDQFIRSIPRSSTDESSLHNFILHPMSIEVRMALNETAALKRKSSDPTIQNSALVRLEVSIPLIAVSTDPIQLTDLLKVLGFMLDRTYYMNRRFRRPTCSVKENPRAWFQYAACTIRDRCKGKISPWAFPDFVHKKELRHEYIVLRRRHKLSVAKKFRKQKLTATEKQRLQQLEDEQQFKDVLLWRHMCESSIKSALRLASESSEIHFTTSSTPASALQEAMLAVLEDSLPPEIVDMTLHLTELRVDLFSIPADSPTVQPSWAESSSQGSPSQGSPSQRSPPPWSPSQRSLASPEPLKGRTSQKRRSTDEIPLLTLQGPSRYSNRSSLAVVTLENIGMDMSLLGPEADPSVGICIKADSIKVFDTTAAGPPRIVLTVGPPSLAEPSSSLSFIERVRQSVGRMDKVVGTGEGQDRANEQRAKRFISSRKSMLEKAEEISSGERGDMTGFLKMEVHVKETKTASQMDISIEVGPLEAVDNAIWALKVAKEFECLEPALTWIPYGEGGKVDVRGIMELERNVLRSLLDDDEFANAKADAASKRGPGPKPFGSLKLKITMAPFCIVVPEIVGKVPPGRSLNSEFPLNAVLIRLTRTVVSLDIRPPSAPKPYSRLRPLIPTAKDLLSSYNVVDIETLFELFVVRAQENWRLPEVREASCMIDPTRVNLLVHFTEVYQASLIDLKVESLQVLVTPRSVLRAGCIVDVIMKSLPAELISPPPQPSVTPPSAFDPYLVLRLEVGVVQVLVMTDQSQRSFSWQPVLDVEIDKIKVGLATYGPLDMMLSARLSLLVDAFNRKVYMWEPLLEPWTVTSEVRQRVDKETIRTSIVVNAPEFLNINANVEVIKSILAIAIKNIALGLRAREAVSNQLFAPQPSASPRSARESTSPRIARELYGSEPPASNLLSKLKLAASEKSNGVDEMNESNSNGREQEQEQGPSMPLPSYASEVVTSFHRTKSIENSYSLRNALGIVVEFEVRLGAFDDADTCPPHMLPFVWERTSSDRICLRSGSTTDIVLSEKGNNSGAFYWVSVFMPGADKPLLRVNLDRFGSYAIPLPREVYKELNLGPSAGTDIMCEVANYGAVIRTPVILKNHTQISIEVSFGESQSPVLSIPAKAAGGTIGVPVPLAYANCPAVRVRAQGTKEFSSKSFSLANPGHASNKSADLSFDSVGTTPSFCMQVNKEVYAHRPGSLPAIEPLVVTFFPPLTITNMLACPISCRLMTKAGQILQEKLLPCGGKIRFFGDPLRVRKLRVAVRLQDAVRYPGSDWSAPARLIPKPRAVNILSSSSIVPYLKVPVSDGNNRFLQVFIDMEGTGGPTRATLFCTYFLVSTFNDHLVIRTSSFGSKVDVVLPRDSTLGMFPLVGKEYDGVVSREQLYKQMVSISVTKTPFVSPRSRSLSPIPRKQSLPPPSSASASTPTASSEASSVLRFSDSFDLSFVTSTTTVSLPGEPLEGSLLERHNRSLETGWFSHVAPGKQFRTRIVSVNVRWVLANRMKDHAIFVHPSTDIAASFNSDARSEPSAPILSEPAANRIDLNASTVAPKLVRPETIRRWEESGRMQHVGPAQRVAFDWDKKGKRRTIHVKLADEEGSCWSGSVMIDSASIEHIALRSTSQPPVIARVQCETFRATTVIFFDVETHAPYVICNYLPISIQYQQRNTDYVGIIPPGGKDQYAWECPAASDKLLVCSVPDRPEISRQQFSLANIMKTKDYKIFDGNDPVLKAPVYAVLHHAGLQKAITFGLASDERMEDLLPADKRQEPSLQRSTSMRKSVSFVSSFKRLVRSPKSSFIKSERRREREAGTGSGTGAGAGTGTRTGAESPDDIRSRSRRRSTIQEQSAVLELEASLAGVAVSVVDERPVELLLVTLQGLDISIQQPSVIQLFTVSLQHLQVDQMGDAVRDFEVLLARPVKIKKEKKQKQKQPELQSEVTDRASSRQYMRRSASAGPEMMESMAAASAPSPTLHASSSSSPSPAIIVFTAARNTAFHDVMSFEKLNVSVQPLEVRLHESSALRSVGLFMDLAKAAQDDLAIFANKKGFQWTNLGIDLEEVETLPEATKRVHVQELVIDKLEVYITAASHMHSKDMSRFLFNSKALETIINSTMNTGRIRLDISSVSMKNLFDTSDKLVLRLAQQFAWQGAKAAQSVIGRLGILGDPMGFVNGVSTGVFDFFNEPAQAFVRQPSHLPQAFARGSGSLAKNVLSSTYTSFNMFLGTLSRMAGEVLYEDNSLFERRRALEDKGARTTTSGVKLGGKMASLSMAAAAINVVQAPAQGFRKAGVMGLTVGTLKGVVGLGVQPLRSILDFAEGLESGISHQPDSDKRMRLPRTFGKLLEVVPYMVERSTAQDIVTGRVGVSGFGNTKHRGERVLDTVTIGMHRAGRLIILTDRSLLEWSWHSKYWRVALQMLLKWEVVAEPTAGLQLTVRRRSKLKGEASPSASASASGPSSSSSSSSRPPSLRSKTKLKLIECAEEDARNIERMLNVVLDSDSW
eukprot:CAMPEP_0184675602 /NCGR_PEP_ID=MMETSP0308-20130426/87878_1 /TAXON_ID=38269 /ORGANISM="Gloeochaete witrockiana, Strain SAG 46.84" /LENGTH=2653 /DNA_ID=CAMNT_0027123321 /DNA_START=302 /DNA_END=8261 /DNA_ORIENTATION=-